MVAIHPAHVPDFPKGKTGLPARLKSLLKNGCDLHFSLDKLGYFETSCTKDNIIHDHDIFTMCTHAQTMAF